MPRVDLRDYRKARTPFGSLMRLFRYFKHCRLILITALDQKRMAEVNVECYPKEQLNEVIRTVLAEYDHPKVLYMPQATLTLPLVKE